MSAPDVALALEPYSAATLGHAPERRGDGAFHVRLGRRAWRF